MPYKKGESGNPSGRPKQTKKQKKDKEQFKTLLHDNTVSALKSIIEIADNPKSKDRFKACRYIIDKAYGEEALLEYDTEVIFKIVNATGKDDKTIITYDEEEDDDEWEK